MTGLLGYPEGDEISYCGTPGEMLLFDFGGDLYEACSATIGRVSEWQACVRAWSGENYTMLNLLYCTPVTRAAADFKWAMFEKWWWAQP